MFPNPLNLSRHDRPSIRQAFAKHKPSIGPALVGPCRLRHAGLLDSKASNYRYTVISVILCRKQRIYRLIERATLFLTMTTKSDSYINKGGYTTFSLAVINFWSTQKRSMTRSVSGFVTTYDRVFGHVHIFSNLSVALFGLGCNCFTRGFFFPCFGDDADDNADDNVADADEDDVFACRGAST